MPVAICDALHQGAEEGSSAPRLRAKAHQGGAIKGDQTSGLEPAWIKHRPPHTLRGCCLGGWCLLGPRGGPTVPPTASQTPESRLMGHRCWVRLRVRMEGNERRQRLVVTADHDPLTGCRTANQFRQAAPCRFDAKGP